MKNKQIGTFCFYQMTPLITYKLKITPYGIIARNPRSRMVVHTPGKSSNKTFFRALQIGW
jgi:hypothetical protein